MSIPYGHGMQYLQSVQGIFWLSFMLSATFSRNLLSSSDSGTRGENVRRLSSRCSLYVIPLRTVNTFGKDPAKRNAHAAALSSWRFCFIYASTFCVTLANLPPSNGSMTTTGMSRSANSSYRYSALVSSPIAFCQSAL